MKKLFSLFLSLIACANMLFAESSSITVRLDPQSAAPWDDVYLWAWTNNGNLFDAWPGLQLSQDTSGWWSYTFDSSIDNVNIIWNSGQGAQTINIENVTESTCYALKATTGTQIGVNVLDCATGEQTASSYEHVQIGDLYYNLNGMNHTAEVTYHLYGVTDNYAGLDKIVIPSSVEYLGQDYSVTALGNYAFLKCIDLSTITIPSTVVKTEIMSFAYCTGLDTIFCEALTPPSLGDDVFYSVNQSRCYLIVPEAALEAYKSAAGWQNFLFEGDHIILDYSACELELVGDAIPDQEGAYPDSISGWNWGNVYPMGTPVKEGNVYTWRVENVYITTEGYGFKIRTKDYLESGGIAAFDYGANDGSNLTVSEDAYYDITFVINAEENYMAYTGTKSIPAAVGSLEASNPDRVTKLFRNGQIFILRGDRTYTLTGQEVK